MVITPEKRSAAERIIAAVAECADLTAADLVGADRRESRVYPRHVAMLLCRERLGLSFPRLAEVFHRDHSTTQYGVKAARDRLGAGEQLSTSIASCACLALELEQPEVTGGG